MLPPITAACPLRVADVVGSAGRLLAVRMVSLPCLAASNRLEELPVLLLLAARPAEPGADTGLLDRLAADPLAEVVRPAPLSLGATGGLVRGWLGEPDDGFCQACHAATGGNPFLLLALLSTLRQDGVLPRASQAGRIGELGPRAVARAVQGRLARLPAGTVRLAEAVAVLGTDAELGRAAALAGLDSDAAAAAADALTASELLRPGRPLEFAHPVVRAAVYDGLPPAGRARAHRRAAALLDRLGAGMERVGAQLLSAEPAGDQWVVSALRAAARRALAEGAADAGVTYLRRALAEPPAAAARGELLRELGAAERRAGDPAATGHLRQAVELAAPGPAAAAAATELAQALLQQGEAARADEVLDAALAAVPAADRELAVRLEAELISAAMNGLTGLPLATRRIEGLRVEVRGDNAAEQALLGTLAPLASWRGQPAGEAVRLAEMALAGGRPLAEQTADSLLFYQPVYALVTAGRFEAAGHHLDLALADARARGSLLGFALASHFRSLLALRRGQLADGEAEASNAVEAGLRLPWPLGLPAAVSGLVDVLVERGELDAAEAALVHAGAGDAPGARLPDAYPTRMLLHSRGMLRLAQGRAAEGLDDLEELDRRARRSPVLDPFQVPFRLGLALVHAALGQAERARLPAGTA